MSTRFARAPVFAWCGLAALWLSLAPIDSARAADPAPGRRVTVKLGTAEPSIETHALPVAPVVPDADPMAGLGLLQRLALLIDMIATGRTEPETPIPAAAPGEEPATATAAGAIVPYAGPLAAGTVIVNLERYQIYRILEGGWAQLYQERSEAGVLARIGVARQGTSDF